MPFFSLLFLPPTNPPPVMCLLLLLRSEYFSSSIGRLVRKVRDAAVFSFGTFPLFQKLLLMFLQWRGKGG